MKRSSAPRLAKTCAQALGFSITATLFVTLTTHAETPFSINDYLNEVSQKNAGIQGSSLSAKASELRANESRLVTALNLYANFETKSDAKITPFSFLQYDRLATNTFSLGVMKTFDFGLQTKLHYDVISLQYLNPQSSLIPGIGTFFGSPYNVASPVLELSQSLWNNGFGRTTRASKELIEAQNLASSHLNSFQAKNTLVQAELTYWRLAAARQVIEVQNQAIDRAQKIYDWNKNRVNLHLGDEADELQAEALLQSRGLDVLTAQNEERAASREFNSARNQDSDSVPEKLHQLALEDLSSVEIPKRAELREDVRAAKEAARITQANSVIQTEKNLPNLDIYGSFALNGQPQNLMAGPYNGSLSLGQTLGLSVLPNRPSYTLGIRFSMPLDFETVSQSQESWRQEKAAAELTYDRKLFEQEESWKDLNQKLDDSKNHLKLSQVLEVTQKKKLEKEQERLKRGRTTTFQVLLFEQDYLFSQLGRIKDQIALLNVVAQMKLFGESR